MTPADDVPARPAPDFAALEGGIAELLPSGGASPNRPLLLRELSAYATAAVREARRAGELFPTGAECARALEWLDRPVFVCGHHRSGTTLLLDLLDGHPELRVLPNEGTYLTMLRYAARGDASPSDADRFAAEWICRFADPNFEPHFLLGRSGPADNPSVRFARRLFGWQAALLGAWPRRAPFALLLALVAAYGDVVAPGAAPRSWAEKTPFNERFVDRLAAAFPRARFVHLVRDPLVTLASVIEAYRDPGPARAGGSSCFGHVRSIRRSLELATRNARRWPGSYLVVRYEDLARDPARAMERVRVHLELAPSPTLATPTVLGQPVRSNSSFERGAAGVVVPPRPGPALPDDASELVRAFAASPARALGYDVAAVPLRRRVRLLARELPGYARRRLGERLGWARSS